MPVVISFSGASAEDALRMLGVESNVDVVLTDVLMPGAMDGVALARRIRQAWPSLPVVLISGNAGVAERTGEFPFIQNPCTPEVMVAVLEGAITPAPT